MSSFDIAYNQTRKFEGGYSNHPKDRGGATIYGISSKNWPNEFATVKSLVDQGRQAEAEEYTKNFYNENFFKPSGAENAPPELQPLIFDAAVNHGVGTAKKILASSGGDPTQFLNQRQAYMDKIVQNDPSQAVFQKGWGNRVDAQRDRDLTPAEQAELVQLEAQLGGQPQDRELTPQEQEELAQLEAQLGTQPQAPAPQGGMGNAGGAARSFAYGVTGGQIPFGNVISSGIGAGIAYAAKPFTGDPSSYRELYDQAQADTKATQTAHPYASIAGNIVGGLSTLPAAFSKGGGGTGVLGKAVTAGGEKAAEYGRKLAMYSPFAEKGLGKVGNVATRYLGRTALAAPVAGAYAAGEADAGKRGEAFKSGATLGAIASGAVPALAAGVGAGVKGVKNIGQAISPSIDDAGASIAKLAQKYNIPLALDDLTDSKFYKTLISEGKTVPFSNAAEKVKNQMSGFTRAVSKTIGADTDKITPDVVSDSFDRLGKEFDSFFKGKQIDLGQDYGLGLRQQDFINEVADNYAVDGQNILNKYMGQINSTIKPNGLVDGEALGAVRNRLSKIARSSGNPEIASAARDLEQFIIDSVSDVSESGAKEAFKKTKYQYKNLIALEPLLQKAQISGEISPAQLLGRVRQVYGRSFSKGEAGELGDLANIGQYIKETIPNSGTSQRTAARNLLTGNLGVAPFVAFASPPVAIAQALAGVGGVVGNRALQSRNFDAEILAKALQKYEQGKISQQAPSLGNKIAKSLGVSRAGVGKSANIIKGK